MVSIERPLWWQQGIIYQIYPRSFQDSNGDGIGDLPGLLSRLDYLAWLGIDAIWVSPFYPSPMADFGYDVADYTNVDPIFGTLEDVDALLAEAHRRGLKVIIDFVPNHTSDEHPWFLESRASRENPRRDWYVWRDPKPDGSPPNNWLSVWSEPAWTLDAATGQYYLHSYHRKQPDLNWRSPRVKAAMFEVLRFWLERGVDGFRLDAVLHIMKDPLLRDNPPNRHPALVMHKAMGAYDSQRHLYDMGHPDIHQIFRELRQVLESYSDGQPRVSIGEMHIFDWPVWASYYGQSLDELHMPFNFGLLSIPWQAHAVRGLVDAIEAVLPAGSWPNYVLGNHDEPRIASRIGPEGARLGMLLLLTLRGTPTLYYGDEIGMCDGEIPPEQRVDPLGFIAPELNLGRDPERTPMQWDASPNAGFCLPGVRPWLPLASNYKQVNVAVECEDPTSMLALTRQLIALRRTMPALSIGGYRPLDGVPAACFAYLRQEEQQRCLIVLNFSDREQRLTFPWFGHARLLLSTRMDREGAIELAGFSLRAKEGCLFALDHAPQ